jgi:transposase-like protein
MPATGRLVWNENKGETVVITENSETTSSTSSSAPNEPVAPAGDAKRRRRAPRRNLTEEQKREITHLYSETSTPLPEIRQRFGIGDSSLYRLIQQYGGKLRGRTPRATSSTPTTKRAGAATGPKSERRAATKGQGPHTRAASTTRSAASAGQSAGKVTFRVSFVGTRVVSATSMSDAVRQSAAFGATEITRVDRLD